MKYRLLKDKIGYLEWYFSNEKHPEILMCTGFHESTPNQEYIDVLPDVVEEFKPYAVVEFDEHLSEDTMHKPSSSSFYFKSEKKVIHLPDWKWEVHNVPNHYVGIHRAWVEPIE